MSTLLFFVLQFVSAADVARLRGIRSQEPSQNKWKLHTPLKYYLSETHDRYILTYNQDPHTFSYHSSVSNTGMSSSTYFSLPNMDNKKLLGLDSFGKNLYLLNTKENIIYKYDCTAKTQVSIQKICLLSGSKQFTDSISDVIVPDVLNSSFIAINQKGELLSVSLKTGHVSAPIVIIHPARKTPLNFLSCMVDDMAKLSANGQYLIFQLKNDERKRSLLINLSNKKVTFGYYTTLSHNGKWIAGTDLLNDQKKLYIQSTDKAGTEESKIIVRTLELNESGRINVIYSPEKDDKAPQYAGGYIENEKGRNAIIWTPQLGQAKLLYDVLHSCDIKLRDFHREVHTDDNWIDASGWLSIEDITISYKDKFAGIRFLVKLNVSKKHIVQGGHLLHNFILSQEESKKLRETSGDSVANQVKPSIRSVNYRCALTKKVKKETLYNYAHNPSSNLQRTIDVTPSSNGRNHLISYVFGDNYISRGFISPGFYPIKIHTLVGEISIKEMGGVRPFKTVKVSYVNLKDKKIVCVRRNSVKNYPISLENNNVQIVGVVAPPEVTEESSYLLILDNGCLKLVNAMNGKVRNAPAYYLGTGEKIKTLQPNMAHQLVLSHDGKWIFAKNEQELLGPKDHGIADRITVLSSDTNWYAIKGRGYVSIKNLLDQNKEEI